MVIVVFLIFALVALAAAAFVVLPLLRRPRFAEGDSRRPLIATLAGLVTMASGLGIYAMLGTPQIAVYSFTDVRPGQLSADNYPALIATLARRMPGRPTDVEGWTLLGRGYLAMGDAAQAEKALAMAVSAAKSEQGEAPATVLSSYGEAMAQAAGGVTKEAEAAFREALASDPKDLVARYYVGIAMATRGEKEAALSLWESLLQDAPPQAPWRSALIDQMALLKAQTGGEAPNPMAMVARLAGELEANPNDLQGWLRLIRAYSVLGDKTKATAALTRAKTVFASQGDAQAALAQAAKENALN